MTLLPLSNRGLPHAAFDLSASGGAIEHDAHVQRESGRSPYGAGRIAKPILFQPNTSRPARR
jgi:hypothetical protein